MAHVGIALFFLCVGVATVYFSWAYHTSLILPRLLAVLSVLSLFIATNMAISGGLWTFRSWPWPLAMAQGLFVLAVGIAGAYELKAYGVPRVIGLMLPGLILILVAAFLRYSLHKLLQGKRTI